MDRFWSKVEKTDTCWNWTACKNNTGYGLFSINNMMILSHRFSYELHKGKIPIGLEIDHLCRNRLCCNPDHLEAVTGKENIMRGDTGKAFGQRQKFKTHCPKGHPYSGDNLYIKPNGQRNCKECCRISKRVHREKLFNLLLNDNTNERIPQTHKTRDY